VYSACVGGACSSGLKDVVREPFFGWSPLFFYERRAEKLRGSLGESCSDHARFHDWSDLLCSRPVFYPLVYLSEYSKLFRVFGSHWWWYGRISRWCGCREIRTACRMEEAMIGCIWSAWKAFVDWSYAHLDAFLKKYDPDEEKIMMISLVLLVALVLLRLFSGFLAFILLPITVFQRYFPEWFAQKGFQVMIFLIGDVLWFFSIRHVFRDTYDLWKDLDHNRRNPRRPRKILM
jgi:hypothetical protein